MALKRLNNVLLVVLQGGALLLALHRLGTLRRTAVAQTYSTLVSEVDG